MLIKAEGCGGVGEKYARVEDKGPSHSRLLLAKGLTASPSPKEITSTEFSESNHFQVRSNKEAYSGDGHIRSFFLS
jgi:hypothetical protein